MTAEQSPEVPTEMVPNADGLLETLRLSGFSTEVIKEDSQLSGNALLLRVSWRLSERLNSAADRTGGQNEI